MARWPATPPTASGCGGYRCALTGTPIGIGGLIRRKALADVDLGYAFLPEHTGKGYSVEAARAALEYGRAALGLARIIATLSQTNTRSARVLEKLGFVRDGLIQLSGDPEDLLLFSWMAPAAYTTV
ncbi:MAG: GNAT family N-acetyltransferase [Thermoflexales bacterium]